MAKTTKSGAKKTTSTRKKVATAAKATRGKATSTRVAGKKATNGTVTAKKSPRKDSIQTAKKTAKKAIQQTVKKAAKQTVDKAAPKPAAKDPIVTIDRRSDPDRRTADDHRQKSDPVAANPCTIERRAKVTRRRQIDPTTCERDYTSDEVEFMSALDRYKRTSGRMFPTCSEVLEVVKGLGYVKQVAPDEFGPDSSPMEQSTATETKSEAEPKSEAELESANPTVTDARPALDPVPAILETDSIEPSMVL